MLVKHASLAKLMGVAPSNVVIADNGDVIEFTKKGIRKEETVPAGAVLVDSGSIGEIGDVVIHDRKRLAEDGMVVVVIPYSSYDGSLVTKPEIVTRGFIYVKDSEAIMAEMVRLIETTVDTCTNENVHDVTAIKGRVKSSVSAFLYKTTKRSPMVLPVLIEL